MLTTALVGACGEAGDSSASSSASSPATSSFAPQPEVPDAQKPDAADRCVDVIADGFARRCPDGSLYEVPAAEADLEGEADAGAPPELQVKQVGEFARVPSGERVAVTINEFGNINAVLEAGDVAIEFSTADFYSVAADSTRSDFEAGRLRTLNPGERYELELRGTAPLVGVVVYAPRGLLPQVAWQFDRSG